MHATVDEFIEALGRLTMEERLGLLAIAGKYASRTSYTCGKDLLSEAIYRVAERQRLWPRGVPLERFLANAMRSIANHDRERADQQSSHRSLDEEAPPFTGAVGLLSPSAEDLLVEAQRRAGGRAAIEHVRQALAADPVALQVLGGISIGLEARQMLVSCDLDHARYHAARQRVMSRLIDYGRRHPQ
jgi:hypothetical protein